MIIPGRGAHYLRAAHPWYLYYVPHGLLAFALWFTISTADGAEFVINLMQRKPAL